MMAFITHCWKNARPELAVWLVLACTCLGAPQAAQAEPMVPEVSQLRLERKTESVVVSALVNFDLPAAVEDALLKGVPVIFVAEAHVYRDRWYWSDKKVSSAERHMRLVFQPLTRRWRLAVASGLIAGNGLGVALSQTFDTLEEALGTIRRVAGWRIAEVADLDPGTRHRLEFQFRLDASQLPRSLQIGTLGQSDWALAASMTQRFTLEGLK